MSHKIVFDICIWKNGHCFIDMIILLLFISMIDNDYPKFKNFLKVYLLFDVWHGIDKATNCYQ